MDNTFNFNKFCVGFQHRNSFFVFIYHELLDVQGLLLSIVDKLPRAFHFIVCKVLKKLANVLDKVEERC